MIDMVVIKEYTITTLKQQGNYTKTLHNEDTTMPNWCNNKATLKHKDSSMLVRAQEAFDNGKLLNEFIPVPEELRNTISGFYGEGTEQQIELQAQQKANKEKYGYSDWYEFANAKWGVKWDIGGTDSESTLEVDTLTLDFDSAWCPPVEGYNALVALGFEIEAYFYEGGMSFCGYYEGNEEYNDVDEYGIEGDSEWVKKHIPQAIDEAFAISENMAYYEAEELGVEEG